MKNTSFCLLFFVITSTSCSHRDLEKKVQGSWVVNQAFYHEEPLIWNLYSNGFDLKKDNTCILPISDFSHRNTDKETGTWMVFNKNNKSFIEINTTNDVFNRTFEIKNLRKVQDSVSWGYLIKMTLIADSLKLKCTKALYE